MDRRQTHTPGEWRFFMGDICVEGSDGDDRIIAGIGKSCGARSSVYSPIPAHKPEGIANGHLIAAAPELLDALENLTIAIGMGWDLDGVVGAARAVIAKAEGR